MSNRFINVCHRGGNQTYHVPAVYQYDKGLKLCIFGLTTEKIIEIQYGIEGIAQTLNNTPVKDGDKWISDIPNILLTQNREIVCYVCLSDETMSKTIFHVSIPIIEREKPADYQYTEQEIAGYAKLMAELNEAIGEVAELNIETSQISESAIQAADAANKAAEDFEIIKQSVDERINSMQTQIDGLTIEHNGVLKINSVAPDETGNIVINADFVGALPNNYTPPVTSVNGQTGDVVISVSGGEASSVAWDDITGKPDSFEPSEHEHTAEDVGALPEDWLPTVADIEDLQDVIDTSVEEAIAAIGAVRTICGLAPDEYGDVELSASDVCARPDDWVPEITDIEGLQEAIESAGCTQTVCGIAPDSTGNIVLEASDVGAIPEGAEIDAATFNGMTLEELKAEIMAEAVYQ